MKKTYIHIIHMNFILPVELDVQLAGGAVLACSRCVHISCAKRTDDITRGKEGVGNEKEREGQYEPVSAREWPVWNSD